MSGEWFMQNVPLGPDKTFQSRYPIKPVRRFEDFFLSTVLSLSWYAIEYAI